DKFIWGYIGPEVSYLIYEYLWYPMTWGDRATATVSIKVPEGLTAVSVGELVQEVTEGGQTTFTWSTSQPSRGISLAVAHYVQKSILIYPYQLTGSSYGPGGHGAFIPITCYLFPQDASKADSLLENTAEILERFSQKFDGYPYDEFRVVEMPSFFFGGHGDQGFVMVNSVAINLDSEEFLGHEIAHNWWGSLVFAEGRPGLKSIGSYKLAGPKESNLDYMPTSESHNLWLHEGFATYSGILYLEERYGREAMRDSLDAKRDEYLAMRTKYGDRPIAQMEEEYSKGLYHAIVYSKGAYVLHMLRYVVGENAFFDIMNTYQERYREKSATIDDFQQVSEEVAGTDLDWFFDQWIRQVRLPDFTVGGVEVTDTPTGYRVEVEILQTGDVVTTPMDVTLHTTGGKLSKRVWLLNDRKTVTFTTTAEPLYVGLDEGGWLLESDTGNNGYSLDGRLPGNRVLPGLTGETALLAYMAAAGLLLFFLKRSLRPTPRENYI
ncbi:MAG: M1 family metallopeptidase, partial [Euryarchaeota archaeon]|nr:M1 family metallopeptidase [Euryarchaeota archaeon]